MAITVCKVTWTVPKMRNSSTVVLTIIPNAPGGDATQLLLEGNVPLSEWGTSYSVGPGESIVQELPHANLPATIDGESFNGAWTYTFQVTANNGNVVSREIQPLRGMKTLDVDLAPPVQAIVDTGKTEDKVIVIGGKVEVVENKVQEIALVTDGLDVKLNDFQEAIDGYDTDFTDIRTSLDGKTTVYRSTSAPTPPTGGFKENDTWFDLTNGVINQWVNGTWVPTVVDSAGLAQGVRDTIDQAKTDAANAATRATTALTTADGKNTSYAGSTAPTAPSGGFKVGDTWFDSGTDTIKAWSGSAWVVQKFGTGSLAPAVTNSITEAQEAAKKALDSAVLRIDSSRGTAFKNNEISTVLSVTVMRGGEPIRDLATLRNAYGQGVYLEWSWKRLNDSDFGVLSALDPRISQGGFVLTVNPSDVDTKTVFMCSLNA